MKLMELQKYHGTSVNVEDWLHGAYTERKHLQPGTGGEDQWGPGIYLTTSTRRAASYAVKKTGAGFIHLVSTSVQNPCIHADLVTQRDLDKLKAGGVSVDISVGDEKRKMADLLRKKYGKINLTTILKGLGYDSLVVPDVIPGHSQMVVYDSADVEVLRAEEVGTPR